MKKTMAATTVLWSSLILFSVCFVGVVPMAFAGSVWDQETNGSISGYVEDPWGNSVPGIPVVAFADPCWTNWVGGHVCVCGINKWAIQLFATEGG